MARTTTTTTECHTYKLLGPKNTQSHPLSNRNVVLMLAHFGNCKSEGDKLVPPGRILAKATMFQRQHHIPELLIVYGDDHKMFPTNCRNLLCQAQHERLNIYNGGSGRNIFLILVTSLTRESVVVHDAQGCVSRETSSQCLYHDFIRDYSIIQSFVRTNLVGMGNWETRHRASTGLFFVYNTVFLTCHSLFHNPFA